MQKNGVKIIWLIWFPHNNFSVDTELTKKSEYFSFFLIDLNSSRFKILFYFLIIIFDLRTSEVNTVLDTLKCITGHFAWWHLQQFERSVLIARFLVGALYTSSLWTVPTRSVVDFIYRLKCWMLFGAADRFVSAK